jgi:hypothetical protein
MRTTNMNSNNLTALLAALAIVPLYFKEPSQPAPEKWEFASIEVWHSESHIVMESRYRVFTAEEQDGKWECQEYDVKKGSIKELIFDRRSLAASKQEHNYNLAILEMRIEGWEPISASPSELSPYSPRFRPSNIYFKRRSR